MPDIEPATVIAAELIATHQTAKECGFRFLAYLIDMARIEAETIAGASVDFQI